MFGVFYSHNRRGGYHQINTFGADHYETSLNLNMRFNTNRAKRKRK